VLETIAEGRQHTAGSGSDIADHCRTDLRAGYYGLETLCTARYSHHQFREESLMKIALITLSDQGARLVKLLSEGFG
jgi:hypothetical protein